MIISPETNFSDFYKDCCTITARRAVEALGAQPDVGDYRLADGVKEGAAALSRFFPELDNEQFYREYGYAVAAAYILSAEKQGEGKAQIVFILDGLAERTKQSPGLRLPFRADVQIAEGITDKLLELLIDSSV